MNGHRHAVTRVAGRADDPGVPGPAAHPIGEFPIALPRPRDVAEVRVLPRFIDLHKAIWDVLREEVLKGYEQQKRAA